MPLDVHVIWNWLAHTVDWGNAQELFTWIVAGGALYFAARADRKQSEQIKMLTDDRKRTQAEKIAAWSEIKEEVPTHGYFPPSYPTYQVRNASDVPVYSVLVWATIAGRSTVQVIGVVPPGTQSYPVEADEAVPLFREAKLSPSISILFKDASGTFWHRTDKGNLKELSEQAGQEVYKAALAAFEKRRNVGGPDDSETVTGT